MVNMRLMMVSFVHMYIMDKLSVQEYLNENKNVQDFIGNRVFFHDRILECWIKMSQFEFISKDMSLLCNHDQDVDLHHFLSRLDVKDCMDFLLHGDN